MICESMRAELLKRFVLIDGDGTENIKNMTKSWKTV